MRAPQVSQRTTPRRQQPVTLGATTARHLDALQALEGLGIEYGRERLPVHEVAEPELAEQHPLAQHYPPRPYGASIGWR
jgi:hypothetical protein